MLGCSLGTLCARLSRLSTLNAAAITASSGAHRRALPTLLLSPATIASGNPMAIGNCPFWQQQRFRRQAGKMNPRHKRPEVHFRPGSAFYKTSESVGIEGGYISIDTAAIDDYLPTPETMTQLFNGIRYDELPIVFLKVSRNNTLLTVTDAKYRVLMYTSLRLEGFKNAQKKTEIAGQTTGVAAGQRMIRRGVHTVRLQVSGFGPGRQTTIIGLHSAGVKIVSITDFTRLIELGKRPRRIRRGVSHYAA